MPDCTTLETLNAALGAPFTCFFYNNKGLLELNAYDCNGVIGGWNAQWGTTFECNQNVFLANCKDSGNLNKFTSVVRAAGA